MQYSRALVIVTGHSGAPVQPMVDRIASSQPDHVAVKPVGSERSVGYRGRDLENAMASGKAAVVASYDPSSTSVLQEWAEREGIRTHTVFLKVPQELSFSRAMGNWHQAKSGQEMDTLLPEIDAMSESELLQAYEKGEVAMIDKPHYRAEMKPQEMLRRFSAIIHSEPMWEDSIAHDQIVEFEPAYGPDVADLANEIVRTHANFAVETGYATPDPQPGVLRKSEPESNHPVNSPKPSF